MGLQLSFNWTVIIIKSNCTEAKLDGKYTLLNL